jgi:hypothetical protein
MGEWASSRMSQVSRKSTFDQVNLMKTSISLKGMMVKLVRLLEDDTHGASWDVFFWCA